jgi:16S rRNA (guanine527-N7)-methyltransferase
VRHAEGFARALYAATGVATPPSRVLDLGSGGGLPGAVLATAWPSAEFVWLDASERSREFLAWASEELGVADRVQVVRGRAEELAHSGDLRAGFDVVVSRSFGRPAVTAECAAGFLNVGGILLVSEPPVAQGDRWDLAALGRLGLAPLSLPDAALRFRAFSQVTGCPGEFPRSVGRPEKRPLF